MVNPAVSVGGCGGAAPLPSGSGAEGMADCAVFLSNVLLCFRCYFISLSQGERPWGFCIRSRILSNEPKLRRIRLPCSQVLIFTQGVGVQAQMWKAPALIQYLDVIQKAYN